MLTLTKGEILMKPSSNQHICATLTLVFALTSAPLKAAGTEPVGSTPAEFQSFLAKEIAQWANVAKANNIRIE